MSHTHSSSSEESFGESKQFSRTNPTPRPPSKKVKESKYAYVSHTKVTPAIDSAPTKRSRVSTNPSRQLSRRPTTFATTATTTTTAAPTTIEESDNTTFEPVGETENYYSPEVTQQETTFYTSTSTEAPINPSEITKSIKYFSSSSRGTATPIRVITRTFKPVYKSYDQEDESSTSSTVTRTTSSTTAASSSEGDSIESTISSTDSEGPNSADVSTTPSPLQTSTGKKVHYIITVIDPPRSSNATAGEEVGEIRDEYEEDNETIPEEKEKVEDPYAKFETLDFPHPVDTSSRFEFIPSVGNVNGNGVQFSRYNYDNAAQTPSPFRLSPPKFSSKYVESEEKEGRVGFHPQLIPLRTVVTYQPHQGQHLAGGNTKNSPFLTSRTVLYYTSVSPANGNSASAKNSAPSANSIANFQSIPSSTDLSPSKPFENLNAVPAQSYYLENLVRRERNHGGAASATDPDSRLRTIPVVVDYVPIKK